MSQNFCLKSILSLSLWAVFLSGGAAQAAEAQGSAAMDLCQALLNNPSLDLVSQEGPPPNFWTIPIDGPRAEQILSGLQADSRLQESLGWDQIVHIEMANIYLGRESQTFFAAIADENFNFVLAAIRVNAVGAVSLVEIIDEGSGNYGGPERSSKVMAYHRLRLQAMMEEAAIIDGSEAELVADSYNTFQELGDHLIMSRSSDAFAVLLNQTVSVRSTAEGHNVNSFSVGREGVVSLLDLSEDGDNLVMRTRSSGVDQFEVVDLSSGSRLLQIQHDGVSPGYPVIQLHEEGFVVLHTEDNVIDYYDLNGQIQRTVRLDLPREGTELRELGLRANDAYKAIYESETRRTYVFFIGRAPLIIEADGRWNQFEDVRDINEDLNLELALANQDLEGFLSADQYVSVEGIAPNFGRFAQARRSGSGRDYSAQNSIEIFDLQGNVIQSGSPFYSIPSSYAFSHNGRYIALATPGADGPVPTSSETARVFIFSVDDLERPLAVIDDIDLLLIQQMGFSPNDDELRMFSLNSGQILSVEIDLEGLE